jgi:hypothetical protein
MPWAREGLVRTEVSEENIASIIMEKIICALETTLAVTSKRNTLRTNTSYYTPNYWLVFLRRAIPFLVSANVVPSQSILFTLLIEVIYSSETPVLTRAT